MNFWSKMKKAISTALAGIFLLGTPTAKSLEGMLSPKTAYAEESVDALVKEGGEAMLSRDFPKAEKLYLSVLKIEPNNFIALNNLGTIYSNQNRLEEAEKVLKVAIRIKPDNADTYKTLGHVYQKETDYKKAIEIYEDGLKKDQNEFSFYYGLGICYKELNNYQVAIKMFEEYLIKYENSNLKNNRIFKRMAEESIKYKTECLQILSKI